MPKGRRADGAAGKDGSRAQDPLEPTHLGDARPVDVDSADFFCTLQQLSIDTPVIKK
jgi:hypothetical protein